MIKFYYISGLILILSSLVSQADVTVSNVRASQRAGSNLVDLYYDLSGTAQLATVSVNYSTDGGVSFPLSATSLTGDLGEFVIPDNNLHIVWDAGSELPDYNNSEMRLRVNAQEVALWPTSVSASVSASYTLYPEEHVVTQNSELWADTLYIVNQSGPSPSSTSLTYEYTEDLQSSRLVVSGSITGDFEDNCLFDPCIDIWIAYGSSNVLIERDIVVPADGIDLVTSSWHTFDKGVGLKIQLEADDGQIIDLPFDGTTHLDSPGLYYLIIRVSQGTSAKDLLNTNFGADILITLE